MHALTALHGTGFGGGLFDDSGGSLDSSGGLLVAVGRLAV
jgi:hypothetical protein